MNVILIISHEIKKNILRIKLTFKTLRNINQTYTNALNVHNNKSVGRKNEG